MTINIRRSFKLLIVDLVCARLLFLFLFLFLRFLLVALLLVFLLFEHHMHAELEIVDILTTGAHAIET